MSAGRPKQFNNLVLFPVPMDAGQRELLKEKAKRNGFKSVARYVRVQLGLEGKPHGKA